MRFDVPGYWRLRAAVAARRQAAWDDDRQRAWDDDRCDMPLGVMSILFAALALAGLTLAG